MAVNTLATPTTAEQLGGTSYVYATKTLGGNARFCRWSRFGAGRSALQEFRCVL
jgi:hypothetical protein